MSVLYKTLTQLCEKRGITPYRMCKDTGMQPSIMTDLKKGRRHTVKAETAAKLAAYFEVTVDYLLGNDEKEKPIIQEDNELSEILEEVRRNPDLRAMFSLAKNATPEEVRQYINVIKAIKGDVDE